MVHLDPAAQTRACWDKRFPAGDQSAMVPLGSGDVEDDSISRKSCHSATCQRRCVHCTVQDTEMYLAIMCPAKRHEKKQQKSPRLSIIKISFDVCLCLLCISCSSYCARAEVVGVKAKSFTHSRFIISKHRADENELHWPIIGR